MTPYTRDARRLAENGEPMPKRKEPELAPAEQRRRFIEAAKKAGVSNDEKQHAQVLKRVAKSDKKPKA